MDKIQSYINQEIKNIVGFVASSGSAVSAEDISNAVKKLSETNPELFSGLSESDVEKIIQTSLTTHDSEEHAAPTLDEAKEYLGMKEV